jgi:hypothetical protein
LISSKVMIADPAPADGTAIGSSVSASPNSADAFHRLRRNLATDTYVTVSAGNNATTK